MGAPADRGARSIGTTGRVISAIVAWVLRHGYAPEPAPHDDSYDREIRREWAIYDRQAARFRTAIAVQARTDCLAACMVEWSARANRFFWELCGRPMDDSARRGWAATGRDAPTFGFQCGIPEPRLTR